MLGRQFVAAAKLVLHRLSLQLGVEDAKAHGFLAIVLFDVLSHLSKSVTSTWVVTPTSQPASQSATAAQRKETKTKTNKDSHETVPTHIFALLEHVLVAF